MTENRFKVDVNREYELHLDCDACWVNGHWCVEHRNPPWPQRLAVSTLAADYQRLSTKYEELRDAHKAVTSARQTTESTDG